MKLCIPFTLCMIFILVAVLWASDIVLLDPPPDGFEYDKPVPVNVGGKVMWIANKLVVVKPTRWQSVKEETKWIIGISVSIVGVLGGLLKLKVLHFPGKGKQ